MRLTRSAATILAILTLTAAAVSPGAAARAQDASGPGESGPGESGPGESGPGAAGVPAREGNVWNGQRHQPAADAAPLPPAQAAQQDREVEELRKRLQGQARQDQAGGNDPISVPPPPQP